MKLALSKKQEIAVNLLKSLENEVGKDLVEAIISNLEADEAQKALKFEQISQLEDKLRAIGSADAKKLLNLTEYLRKKSGGQTSKSTPLAASAKFSVSGKRTSKKSLALQAISYENVYVAQVAIGAKDMQTLKAIQEAEAYPGPSIIIAYSHCGEHGFDLKDGAVHQEKAVESGYWPLFRFNPSNPKGKKFKLDSKAPSMPLKDFMYNETRFTRVAKENAVLGSQLLEQAQEEVDHKWERLELYRDM